MAALSIIVPVYRVEKYLHKCIDSILDQTFKDFELILIDDGSPDECGKICDEYAHRDPRVRVIHQENKGLSAARNAGIDIAKGQFIAFVDSDDWVEANIYEVLIENIVKSNTDIAVCGIRNFFESNPYKEDKRSEQIRNMVLLKDQCFEMVFCKDDCISVAAWNKVYKKEIFDDLRYPKGQIYEDNFLILDVLSKCDHAFVTTAKLYNYRRHAESITGGRYREEEMDRIIASQKNYNIFKERYPQYLEYAEAYLYKNCFSILGKMILDMDKVDPNDMSNVINRLNDNIGFILKSREFTLKRKISAVALRIHPVLFKMCVRLQESA